jgi:DNA-directed RNA polymerase specialized sigma24 family protein
MLGSASEADDAVREAWLRLSRSDPDRVENLGGWLTTVVGHVCLDMLRSCKSRPEDVVGLDVASSAASSPAGADPEHEAVLADSVGVAMLVVLETLSPAERRLLSWRSARAWRSCPKGVPSAPKIRSRRVTATGPGPVKVAR